MNTKSISTAVFLCGLFAGSAIPAFSDVELKVGAGEQFASIQAAVDAVPSSPNQPYIIVIAPGRYQESVLITGKATSPAATLTIRGRSPKAVMVDAGRLDHAFQLRDQSYVTIEGLTIKGGVSYGTVFFFRSSKNVIRANVIRGGNLYDAVTLSGSADNLIEKNILVKNNRAGVYLVNSSKDNEIRFNIMAFNRYGIYHDASGGFSSKPVLERWNNYHENRDGDAVGLQISDTSVVGDPLLMVDEASARLSSSSNFRRWGPGGDATAAAPGPKKAN